MTNQELELALKIGLLCALGAFWPYIRRWLYKIGYRDWRKPPEQ